MSSLPRPILVGIAAAWAAAIGAQVAGVAALANHDSLLVGDGPPFVVGALIAILAWQVMIAAMMLPSSLPLIRLYGRATERAPRRGRSMAAFIGGYALIWSAFGLAAFLFDASIHAAVNSSSWLRHHDWWIGGTALAMAGAFQFTPLKDACLDKCRHPAQFLTRYYERGPGGGFKLGARHGAFCVGCCCPDARDVRGRGGESDLDGPPDRRDDPREDPPAGRQSGPCDGPGAAGSSLVRADVLGLRGRGRLGRP